MAIRVALRHRSRYAYDRRVRLSPHVVRLRPAPHSRTAIESYGLSVTPDPHFINWQQDPFGNYAARLVFPEELREFTVTVDLIANLVTINPFDFFLEPYAEVFPFDYEPNQRRDLLGYLQPPSAGPKFLDLLREVHNAYACTGRRTVDVLVDINRYVQRLLRYDIRLEPGVFTPEETLVRGHGSCRDLAWLLVNVLRGLGIAARFASGYSIQLVADQKPIIGPAGVDSDCTDLHAWAEAYLPGAGWVGFDATSGLVCGEGHIPLACTAEPSSAAPIFGSFEFEARDDDDEVECDFSVSMQVTRIEDRPRPTKSYTTAQWEAIVECGNTVDAILQASDVRLTMGGEPTFVAIDDLDAAEWNTDAQGPTKARYADALIRRLRDRFAPQGIITHGQGKWYPGELLPRWEYSIYFRKDGRTIWHDASLLSDGQNAGHDVNVAERFMSRLASLLGVPPERAIAAHEDVFYYLWRERRLPSNLDPFESHLQDETERDRLRRIFTQGLESVVGFALPLRARVHLDATHDWESGSWFLRAERLYLLPGDSPMGFRLPLDSFPWSSPEHLEVEPSPDPFAEFHRLRASVTPSVQPHSDWAADEGEPPPMRGVSAAHVVRTALCVEPRNGTIHVFLPPTPTLEAYLDLVARVETTARELGVAVRIEGYPPPYHPMLGRISITPDPGVLEVNIHPACSWQECVQHTHELYATARLTGLGPDKFMLDGRHTGTGGGNHVVIGGPTPADSPILRKPDLLASLVAFFHNHPALSYVFSGLFVGPTSQAPRMDEARNDSLYEFEIARKLIGNMQGGAPPWLVDRVVRHLLVDLTGNTHRTEFCVDKLYSPDSATGRLGLLELRSFEMPPDARMNCAQQLLVRAMVAQFWRSPYRRRLVRWGTALHDRFALPHFLWEDLIDAVTEISSPDLELDPDWFLPHWEFRFPRVGLITARPGITLELRQALEPWHVLGEEQARGATARYVDSSVERLQLLVDGLTDSRYAVTVNGLFLPLLATGRPGQFVAAIRYKAWKPPSSLHPTLPVDSPLVFDIHDTWTDAAVGGCTYHVSHPGGRSFERLPTNGLEAESRRMARFLPFGHGPQPQRPRTAVTSPEYPCTLDLRIQS